MVQAMRAAHVFAAAVALFGTAGSRNSLGPHIILGTGSLRELDSPAAPTPVPGFGEQADLEVIHA